MSRGLAGCADTGSGNVEDPKDASSDAPIEPVDAGQDAPPLPDPCSDAAPPEPVGLLCDNVPDGFTDCLPKMGIDVGGVVWPHKIGPNNAAAITDCDGDGLPDIAVVNWIGPVRLLHNKGAFEFEDVTAASGIAVDSATAAAFGDLDHDGFPDLVVAMGILEFFDYDGSGPPLTSEIRVYRGDGSCHFTDVSLAWGFGPRPAGTTSFLSSVNLADVNLDGRLDVVLSRSLSPASSVWAYISQPDDKWVDEGDALFGGAAGSSWGNHFVDVDGDGWADVFMFFDGRLGPPARFFHRVPQPGPPEYVEQIFDPRFFGDGAQVTSLMTGMSAEVDGDGIIDHYIADLGPSHLYVHRDGAEVDVAIEAGAGAGTLPDGAPTVAYGTNFTDYDNDTWPDIAVVAGVDDGFFSPAHAFLLHNRGDGTFEDATPLLRQDGPHNQEWITGCDLDRDGRVDYWIGGEAELPRILRNQISGGGSVAVRLRGTTSSTEGVGARVTTWVGDRKQILDMTGGGMMWGYGEHRLVFGVGCAPQVDAIEVRWPDGYVQKLGPAAAFTEVVVEEPEILRVDPTVVAQGAPVTVVVKPAKPDGSLLGAGHQVAITVDPGMIALTVSDAGDGSYVATTSALSPGVHGVTVRIDGAALMARPQILVK